MAGARHDMGLGSYPAVTLAEARIAAADARKQIAQGIDPLGARAAARKAAKPIPTFREVAQEVIAEAQLKSTNAKVRYQWERHLGWTPRTAAQSRHMACGWSRDRPPTAAPVR